MRLSIENVLIQDINLSVRIEKQVKVFLRGTR